MPTRLWAAVLALALPLFPTESAAQLRPLDPLDWSIFAPGTQLIVRAGASGYTGQRASLAGTSGTLLELGEVRVVWRLGRVAIVADGTIRRRFEDERVLTPPAAGVRAPSGEPRIDAGPYRLGTIVRLAKTPAAAAVLRFGTRLPTTNDRIGLGRDRTDFYALFGGRLHSAGFWVAAEAGLGIHGTRSPRYEQNDMILYSLTLGYRRGPLSVDAGLVGQRDLLRGWSIRGTENLRELRVRLRTRTGWAGLWLQTTLVKGLAEYSPDYGMRISLGWTVREPER